MKKILNKLLLITFAILFITNTNFADSKKGYQMAVMFDLTNKSLAATVQKTNSNVFDKENYYGGNISYEGSAELISEKTVSDDENSHKYKNSTNISNYLSWPGTINNAKNATSQEKNMANSIQGNLINELNEAISFLYSYGNSTISSNTSVEEVATELVNSIDSSAYGVSIKICDSNTCGERQKEVDKYAKDEDNCLKGIEIEDYVILSVNTGTNEISSTFRWKVPKGYASGQYLSGKVTNAENLGDEQNSTISWKGLVFFAKGAAKNELYADDNEALTKFFEESDAEKAINQMARNFSDTLTVGIVGGFEIQDLFFNVGTRGTNYYLGMMPNSWFSAANIIFWISEIIAVFMLLASVLWMVYKQNVAVISPIERVNFQDHIANLLISIFLLIMYVPFFYVIAKANSLIVSVFAEIGGTTLLTNSGGFLNVLLTLVLVVFNFFILIKLNIDYIVRALTITVLHAFAPVAIASIALNSQGRRGTYFSTWLKQMVSTIFIQTFDAALLAFFCLVLKSSGELVRIIVFFSFIPMNSWFKKTFGGDSGVGSMSGQVQGSVSGFAGAVGSATALVGGGAAGIAGLLGKNKNKNETDAGTKVKTDTGQQESSQESGDSKAPTINSGGASDGQTNVLKSGNVVGSEGKTSNDDDNHHDIVPISNGEDFNERASEENTGTKVSTDEPNYEKVTVQKTNENVSKKEKVGHPFQTAAKIAANGIDMAVRSAGFQGVTGSTVQSANDMYNNIKGTDTYESETSADTNTQTQSYEHVVDSSIPVKEEEKQKKAEQDIIDADFEIKEKQDEQDRREADDEYYYGDSDDSNSNDNSSDNTTNE